MDWSEFVEAHQIEQRALVKVGNGVSIGYLCFCFHFQHQKDC